MHMYHTAMRGSQDYTPFQLTPHNHEPKRSLLIVLHDQGSLQKIFLESLKRNQFKDDHDSHERRQVTNTLTEFILEKTTCHKKFSLEVRYTHEDTRQPHLK